MPKDRKVSRMAIVLVLESILLAGCLFCGVHMIRQYMYEKAVFMNQAYFLMTDIAEGLPDMKNGEAATFELYRDLTELDTICRVQSRETAFVYREPGAFECILEGLAAGEYDENERLELADDLQAVISKLSDQTGRAENTQLSYREWQDALWVFCDKWER